MWRAVRDLVPLLPGRARLFLWLYMGATAVLSLFDVAAMSLLALTITAVASDSGVSLPLIGQLAPDMSVGLILIACALIIIKSALAVWLHRIATRQFAVYELEIGIRLFRAYLTSTWEERSKRSTIEFTRIADTGISVAISGMILSLLTLPGNVLTIILTMAVLVFAQPVTALLAFAYLGAVAFVLNQIVSKRTLEASRVDLTVSHLIARLLTEMVDSLKELTLRNKLADIQKVVEGHRREAVDARARKAFLAIIPRYGYEAALIGGFVLIGGVAYWRGGQTAAVVAVAMFATAGMRLIPALTGIQSAMISVSASIPWVRDVVDDLRGAESNPRDALSGVDVTPLPTSPRNLQLSEVSFTYPASSHSVLRNVGLTIPLGSTLGIVGPSGSGKSTLIDILLGLRAPTSGMLSIDGIRLDDVIHSWRSRIGYVPQRVTLFDGTIGQNIALTWDDDYDREKVLEVIEKAQLTSLIEDRGRGIDERIGERGATLSGGQQQRLGIARALYSDPLVLVLDEATSALDTKTEDDVVRALKSLEGEVTIVAVAHRISTIKDYDQICYLDQGTVLGIGSFVELAQKVPQFGLQVSLAGLDGHKSQPRKDS
jgi:ABC-type bacteriocin/lantibiotic exporter with double-glycine peptidase domain